ncbi:hypothetical protein AFR_27225 [Actinoplanes friuliensis DSM 7358]|uniref:Integral membrane protein n=1 Tax=Actinoplanes friuliensis DSM 7358 TaxID=1246995 RepID=U5W700_9ACTN|nr:hypothetical protein AFR_27225 [Actinoplanes friuliensis DSM 7358]
MATIVALALLAVPRAVLHDLDVIHEGTVLNAVLVFVPLLIWVVVAVLHASNPFLALLATGCVYGLCLAVVHTVFWSPGTVDTAIPDLVLRGAVILSSLFTGIALGTVCGVVAWGLGRLRTSGCRRSRR